MVRPGQTAPASELPISQEADLQLITPSDGAVLLRLVDTENWRLQDDFNFGDQTPDGASQWCADEYDANQKGNRLSYWIREHQVPVGQIAMAHYGEADYGNSNWMAGYWLSTEVEGRGLATAAVRTTLDYAFSERGVTGVDFWIRVENRRSRNLARRLGARLQLTHDDYTKTEKWIVTPDTLRTKNV